MPDTVRPETDQPGDFWRRDAAANLAALGVTADGLTSAAALALVARHGPNALPGATRRPVWLDALRRLLDDPPPVSAPAPSTPVAAPGK